MIPIDDPDDPRLAAYRAVRDRDLAERAGSGRGGRFVAEGAVVLRTLLSGRSRFRVESVLVASSQADRCGWLADDTRGAPVYVAGRDVMDRIVGFPVHRGLLGIGLRGDPIPAGQVLAAGPQPSLALGLIGLSNHDNVGAAFRNAAAFGADAVLLDRGCCDPLYRKAVRVSVGATLTVPFAHGGEPDGLVSAFRAAGYEVLGLTPRGREPLEDLVWPRRAAILVGAEGPGLPGAVLDRCRTVRIGMAPDFDSLNVATAAAIALHAAQARARLGAGD